jgi:hypothetical protein
VWQLLHARLVTTADIDVAAPGGRHDDGQSEGEG